MSLSWGLAALLTSLGWRSGSGVGGGRVLFLDAHSVTVEGTVMWTNAIVQTPVRRSPWALQCQGTAGLAGYVRGWSCCVLWGSAGSYFCLGVLGVRRSGQTCGGSKKACFCFSARRLFNFG